jgi:hypothetical protein
LNTFSQLPAVKKYSKNGAAGKFFGPSYFDPALILRINSLKDLTSTKRGKILAFAIQDVCQLQ